jgi:hypothetical protein
MYYLWDAIDPFTALPRTITNLIKTRIVTRSPLLRKPHYMSHVSDPTLPSNENGDYDTMKVFTALPYIHTHTIVCLSQIRTWIPNVSWSFAILPDFSDLLISWTYNDTINMVLTFLDQSAGLLNKMIWNIKKKKKKLSTQSLYYKHNTYRLLLEEGGGIYVFPRTITNLIKTRIVTRSPLLRKPHYMSHVSDPTLPSNTTFVVQ